MTEYERNTEELTIQLTNKQEQVETALKRSKEQLENIKNTLGDSQKEIENKNQIISELESEITVTKRSLTLIKPVKSLPPAKTIWLRKQRTRKRKNKNPTTQSPS